jgi:steroid delta-isomerase-like uncharacterized protein
LAPTLAGFRENRGLSGHYVRLKNEHDLEGVLGTFGDTARYDDEPWDEHYDRRSGVRLFYEQLIKALPDLEIDIQRRHITDDAILLEVMIRGTHLRGWRGLPCDGESSRIPAIAVYTLSTEPTVWLWRKSTTTAAWC